MSINRHRTHLLSDPANSGLKSAGMENRFSVGKAGVRYLTPFREKDSRTRSFMAQGPMNSKSNADFRDIAYVMILVMMIERGRSDE